jgi:branched-subunit amino acid aminotransferase/4-amino-4-deoxychorismate lyase
MTQLQENLGFWYNGEWCEGDQLTLSIQDPGLLYGATLFTTLRVFDQNLDHPLTHWTAHLNRLRTLPPHWIEPNWDRIRQGCETLSILNSQFSILRITLFPDGREWITARSLPPDLPQRQTQGIRVQLLDPTWSRSLPQWKTGNYLAPWLGLRSALAEGLQEAILVNPDGHWLETTTGNLWGLKDGIWRTPPLEAGILGGVMRSWILEQLEETSQPPSLGELWTPEFVKSLEAIGYSNCVVGLVPIQEVCGVGQWNSADCAALKSLQGKVLGSRSG